MSLLITMGLGSGGNEWLFGQQMSHDIDHDDMTHAVAAEAVVAKVGESIAHAVDVPDLAHAIGGTLRHDIDD